MAVSFPCGMIVQELIKRVKEHDLFITFFDVHPDAYLAYVFFQDNIFQIGFFDSRTQRMTTFVVSGERIDRIEDQEVLHKEGTLLPLDIDKCLVSVEQAKSIFLDVHKKNYSSEKVNTQFIILQQTTEGLIYNMTALTASLKTLNVRIFAENGNLISFSCDSLVYDDAKL